MGVTTKYARLRDTDAQQIIMAILGYQPGKFLMGAYLKKPDMTSVITTRLADGSLGKYFQIKFRDVYNRENTYEIVFDEKSGPILKYTGMVRDFLTHFGMAIDVYKKQPWMELCPLFNEIEDKIKNPRKEKKPKIKLNMYSYKPECLQAVTGG